MSDIKKGGHQIKSQESMMNKTVTSPRGGGGFESIFNSPARPMTG